MARYQSGLMAGSAKPWFAGSNPARASFFGFQKYYSLFETVNKNTIVFFSDCEKHYSLFQWGFELIFKHLIIELKNSA